MADFDQEQPEPKEQQSDFQILVTEPTRSEKDFSAKITTKTTLSQFKASNFFCLRSYADFLWLSEELTQKHLDCIIPILPPKSLVKVSENTERLFCSSLQFYLNRIAAHPILQKDPNFQKFLEGETIVPSKKTQTQLIGEAGMEVLSLLKKTAEGDTYFEDKRAFVNIHENNTKSCAKAVERLHKAGTSFSASTKDAGAKYVAVADATTEDKLSTGLKNAGKSLEQHHEILATQIENQQELLTEFFHQGARDLQAGRNALDNRLQMSVDYDKAVKNTKSKREAFEKLRGNPQTKPDKLSKGQADVAEAEKQESDAKDLFFNTTENLKNEFARLEKERVQVSKEKLKEHVQNQIFYEKKSLKVFQDLLLEVEAISL